MKYFFSDAPRDYQLFFQDTATPMMSGIIDLHQHIFFFIIKCCLIWKSAKGRMKFNHIFLRHINSCVYHGN